MKPSASSCLVIAGWDPSGGAGVLADCQTAWRLGHEPQAVLTTTTVQNRHGVQAVHPLPAARVRAQLEALAREATPRAVKIGLVPSAVQVELLMDWARGLPAGVPLVVDPVIWASSGRRLASPAALRAWRRLLPGRVSALTPNAREAAALLGRPVHGAAGRRRAARLLGELVPLVVVTGGDGRGPLRDWLAATGKVEALAARRLPGRVRGTGCRFSTALACFLAEGLAPAPAARRAAALVRQYISRRG